MSFDPAISEWGNPPSTAVKLQLFWSAGWRAGVFAVGPPGGGLAARGLPIAARRWCGAPAEPVASAMRRARDGTDSCD